MKCVELKSRLEQQSKLLALLSKECCSYGGQQAALEDMENQLVELTRQLSYKAKSNKQCSTFHYQDVVQMLEGALPFLGDSRERIHELTWRNEMNGAGGDSEHCLRLASAALTAAQCWRQQLQILAGYPSPTSSVRSLILRLRDGICRNPATRAHQHASGQALIQRPPEVSPRTSLRQATQRLSDLREKLKHIRTLD